LARIAVDLDGTLLDTRRRHHAVYVEALQALGGDPLSLAAYWRAKRRATPWPRLLGASLDAARFLEIWADRIEAADMLALDGLHPGVERALDRLAAADYRAVLVTARRQAAALDAQLRDLGLDRRFERVVATAGRAKALALEAVGRVDAWIGDTEEDVAAARALGVPVTAVTNGIRSPSRLAAAGPDELVRSFPVAARRLLARR
jgi:phosphoglycolate phosphatase-like HAD superfamily hydrolase